MDSHLVNETSISSLHKLRDLWKSPRGTVLHIEALALVAIILSFFLAAFGSCRRWSNRWIIQKGFVAAHVLSLSLGTYSIGLMQSSSVKSEMYPIWAVSLLTLVGCVDPVTGYVGLDYKGPFLKIIFQLFLYCGYVLLISVSTISSVVGNLAIGVLSSITFFKGFHMSLALVLPSKLRNELNEEEDFIRRLSCVELDSTETLALAGRGERLRVHLRRSIDGIGVGFLGEKWITMADVHKNMGALKLAEVSASGLTIEDVCLGYSLSHLLHRRFLGLDSSNKEMVEGRKAFESLVGGDGCAGIDYMQTLKVIEVELAFLYEVYFSSNEFLHFYQAKTASFWALASFIGICFVGLAAAIPRTMAGRYPITNTTSPAGAGTIDVDTTTADRIITLAILVSLGLLQLVQLIRCWTSNFARVAFACQYIRIIQQGSHISSSSKKDKLGQWWMRLKVLAVTRMNWFEKYLWQDKLGQYSLVDIKRRERDCSSCLDPDGHDCYMLVAKCRFLLNRFSVNTGMQYVSLALKELLLSKASNTGPSIRLHDDVKTSIADFLFKIKSTRIGKEWSSVFVANGIDASYLPYSNAPFLVKGNYPRLLSDDPSIRMSDAYAFTHRVMMWHIATWHCNKQSEHQEEGSAGGVSDDDREIKNRNRRVAIALSKYCAYLVVSAPELLPGPSKETERAFDNAECFTGEGIRMERMRQWGLEQGLSLEEIGLQEQDDATVLEELNLEDTFAMGVHWGKWLLNTRIRRHCSTDHWELLALVWVQTLIYAAPYGDVQKHMLHLSQGGEFITHLWALFYHLGIDKWEHEDAAGET